MNERAAQILILGGHAAQWACMATGFTPFDPGLIASYHTRSLKKVITTARLNTLIREETLILLDDFDPENKACSGWAWTVKGFSSLPMSATD